MQDIRKISQEVESNYPDPEIALGLKKLVSQAILDKYLKEDHPCIDAAERCLLRLTPYWNITWPRFKNNSIAMFKGQWRFDVEPQPRPVLAPNPNLTTSIMLQLDNEQLYTKNISIYLGIWVPLTTMLIAHVLHNKPGEETRFGVFTTGIIMFVSMMITSYAMYVYSNLIDSNHNLFLQHFCISSYVNLVGFVYACVCAATPDIVLIPLTGVYILASIFLHFRIYNNAFKPTLFELVIVIVLLTAFYIGTAVTFYANFAWWIHEGQVKSEQTLKQAHDLMRHFAKHDMKSL